MAGCVETQTTHNIFNWSKIIRMLTAISTKIMEEDEESQTGLGEATLQYTLNQPLDV